MSTCKTKTSFSHLHFHNCIASLLCGFHRCVFFSALDIDLPRVLYKYYVILQTSRLKAKAILKQFRGWKWETNGKRSEENIAVDVDKFFTSSVATWDDAKRLTNWTNQHRHRTRVNPDICLQSARLNGLFASDAEKSIRKSWDANKSKIRQLWGKWNSDRESISRITDKS